MFYRRKLILAMLQLFDGRLDKIRLQKLLFLTTGKQAKADYDFIPYKFGCYSYSVNADLTVMVTKGFLFEDETYFEKKDKVNYLIQLKPSDLRALQQVRAMYGEMSPRELMRYTYINFPFYATKSEVAGKILNPKELENVRNAVITVECAYNTLTN